MKRSGKKKTELCSIEPDFPREAFIICLFPFKKSTDRPMGIISLYTLFTSPEKVKETVLELIDQTLKKEENIDYDVVPECVLIPVSFSSTYPLKTEHWQEPVFHYDVWDREKMFIEVIKNVSEYDLLVLPLSLDEKLFSACLPLKTPYSKENIEKFLNESDEVVDQRAKHAAIYTFREPMRFNWETGELEKAESSREELLN